MSELLDESWADLPDRSVRRALDTAAVDLRGSIHVEELEAMIARLALGRLADQRTALHALDRQPRGPERRSAWPSR